MAEPSSNAARPAGGGLIGWFAGNHVAANLLMIAIVIGGIGGLVVVKKESFPSIDFQVVQVAVPYLGAAPEEVEEGVVIKVEEAIKSIEGIHRIESTASEGTGLVYATVAEGYSAAEVMDKIKLRVDSIATFPRETERPSISSQVRQRGVITLQIHGALDEAALTRLAQTIRDEVTALPEVSAVDLQGARPFEISVDVSEQTLRQYGLTLDDVATAIRRWSVDLPGGAIRSDAGDIRLRAKGQAYTGAEFEQIVLLTRPDGVRLRLGDIATINDGFADVESFAFFDGKPSLAVAVHATPTENEIAIAQAVREYAAQREATLPPGVKLTIWSDSTYYLNSRINLMLENLAAGAALVFIILGLFLRLRIAIWVAVGLPVAFMGAFMLLPSAAVGVSINTMSLFAFIVVLGIVVDDAIIIGESIYAETQRNGYTLANVIAGTKRVAVPATFGVLTTIMAFAPLLFISGTVAQMSQSIGWVVVLCLVFSLVESKLILPSHLAAYAKPKERRRGIGHQVERGLMRFIENVYTPFLTKAIEFRYATVAFFVALMILAAGLVSGGVVRFIFFPNLDLDYVAASVQLQEGAPRTLVRTIVEKLDQDLREVNEDIKAETGTDRDVAQHSFAYIRGGNQGHLQVELDKRPGRVAGPADIERRWREKAGEIAGVRELRFYSSTAIAGKPISFALSGRDYDVLEQAAEALRDHLRGYSGLYEVQSSARTGPDEIKLRVKPEAEALGITLTELARQVRQAFYGEVAQRIQRGTNEVWVWVRYPRSERRSIGNLENMWIRLPDGRELPFGAVAEYEMAQGYSALQRLDGQSTVIVSANADLDAVEPFQVLGQVQAEFMPDLLARYPGVRSGWAEGAQEQAASLRKIGWAFVAALLGIYAVMAIPLRSYVQPLLIMSAIPFGVIGAVLGHMLLDLPITAISLVGILALAGVVVNDSLIMVDFVNRAAARGATPTQAAVESGAARFRAILLTSLTTFFGLLPIMFETSTQAQMVVQMAVSLGFGILFATVITLVLVPCLYNIVADAKRTPRTEAVPPGGTALAAEAGGGR